MTRKALLVGVDDYGSYAERLSAPVYEIGQFETLLKARPYKFNSVLLLPNEQATRERVLDELRRLLEGARPDDQLLFYFAGHGSISTPGSGSEAEQSIIVSGSDLQSASIRESEVRRVFEKARPPLGTDITFILDCCHSAGYADLMLRNTTGSVNAANSAVPLFAPPATDTIRNFRSIRRFGEFAEGTSVKYEKPVVLAAAGEHEVAYQITKDGRPRMLFTMRLLEWLAETRDTFIGIRDNINPLHREFRQVAQLGGNRARWTEKFPGEPTIFERRGDESDEPVVESVGDGETPAAASVNVRVMGLATFVNARVESAPYKARVVLPYDEGLYVTAPEDRHYAYLSIPREDMRTPPEGPLARRAEQYEIGGVEHSLWRLDGYTVTIQTGDPSVPFTRTRAFEDHVPKMTELAPELRPYDPDTSCFEEGPLLNRLAAFVNLPGGVADVGTLRTEATEYVRANGTRTYGPVKTPISVKVNVPVATEYVTIVLRPYLDRLREDLIVELNAGATILVANARKVDVLGDPGGDIPKEQFLLYYKLAPAVPRDPPLPAVTGVPRDDCTVTDWP
ncbi:MAG TPA: caspase family protein [Thermoanaerobaculia bacterium]|jgi:hypothetical protein|nr:caspase family protein [Thermoanaerobaculia bacterium]